MFAKNVKIGTLTSNLHNGASCEKHYSMNKAPLIITNKAKSQPVIISGTLCTTQHDIMGSVSQFFMGCIQIIILVMEIYELTPHPIPVIFVYQQINGPCSYDVFFSPRSRSPKSAQKNEKCSIYNSLASEQRNLLTKIM